LKLLASVLATVVIAATLLGASAQGSLWIYVYDDETETSATWYDRGESCDTNASGANDGVVQCYPLLSAPWGEPWNHSPVSILDIYAPVNLQD
jgi:hypothetical protein